MSKPKSLEELAQRLQQLDSETLFLLRDSMLETKRLKRTQAVVTSAIASVAGAAVALTYLFPGWSLYIVAPLSLLISSMLIALSYHQRRYLEDKYLQQLIRTKREAGIEIQEDEGERRRQAIKDILGRGTT